MLTLFNNDVQGPTAAECTMCVFGGHTGVVGCGKFSGDGKHIISGGEDGELRVWSPKANQCVHNFAEAHDDSVLSIACSKTNPIVLTGSADGTAKIFNYETKREVACLTGHTEPVECRLCKMCSSPRPRGTSIPCLAIVTGLIGKHMEPPSFIFSQFQMSIRTHQAHHNYVPGPSPG